MSNSSTPLESRIGPALELSAKADAEAARLKLAQLAQRARGRRMADRQPASADCQAANLTPVRAQLAVAPPNAQLALNSPKGRHQRRVMSGWIAILGTLAGTLGVCAVAMPSWGDSVEATRPVQAAGSRAEEALAPAKTALCGGGAAAVWHLGATTVLAPIAGDVDSGLPVTAPAAPRRSQNGPVAVSMPQPRPHPDLEDMSVRFAAEPLHPR
jgi:hypothetical protein